MNCFNIKTKQWSDEILDFFSNKASDLKNKLSQPVPAGTKIGNISSYWTRRYGIPADCILVAATGDNPSSFAGLNIGNDDICLSLGTSDTVMMAMADPRPQSQGHVFVNPVDADSYMAMLCYKNGSLIRQKLRDKYNLNWNEFGNILKQPLAESVVNICFDYQEIIPPLKGNWIFSHNKDGIQLQESCLSAQVEIRSLIDTQVVLSPTLSLSLALR